MVLLLLGAVEHSIGIQIHLYLYAALGLLIIGKLASRPTIRAMRIASLPSKIRRWRLRVLQTNYGREAGWYVTKDGQQVALLTNPRFEEMFWDSYAVEPLAEEATERQRILSDRDWWLQPGLNDRAGLCS
jgi:hypothetical protein